MNGITYRMQDGYRIPNLLPPQEIEVTIGKYGLLRRRFLQEHRRVMFTNLLTSGRLTEHLVRLNRRPGDGWNRSQSRWRKPRA